MKPNKLQTFLGYITLCIPAAILARAVRKVTGTKGTSFETFLMAYYYETEQLLLQGI